MAKITNLGNETDIQWIFNVSTSVGPNGYNRADDVMLVQHVLNTLLPSLDIRNAKGVRITSYLTRDGLFGRLTKEAIIGYQRNAQGRGLQLTADGMVSSASATGWTKNNVQYTIVHMNRDHLRIYGKMMSEGDFPQLLRQAVGKTPVS